MRKNNGRLWGTILDGKIEIRTLTEDDLEGAIKVLDSFYQNESICNGCEINLPDAGQARAELNQMCRLAALDGISIVAKSVVDNGKPVAVAFNKIQYIPKPGTEPFFIDFRNKYAASVQAKCLMDFMIQVDEQTDVFQMLGADCLLELTFLATSPEWERKGIARTLARYTIELARELSLGQGLEELPCELRDKRPRAVTALFTSQYSQKAGKASGFQVINRVPYTSFTYKGKTFDKRISPLHKYCEHVLYKL